MIRNTSGRRLLGPFFVTDSTFGRILCRILPLPAGGRTGCPTRTHTTTGTDVSHRVITNTATARNPFGRASAPVTARVRFKAGLLVTKQASPKTFSRAGQTITYTYQVKNISPVPLGPGLFVRDLTLGKVVQCPAATLQPGQSTTCTTSSGQPVTHQTTQADVKAGHFTDMASATTDNGAASNIASATVTFKSGCLVTTGRRTFTSLQAGVNAARNDGSVAVTGTCTGTTNVNKNLTISGTSNTATLNGERRGSVVFISHGASVTLNTLIITGGFASAGDLGGGVSNHGTTFLNHSTVTGNTASFGGGMINVFGHMTVTDSTITDNTASNHAGGIDNHGTLVLTGSTVEMNHGSSNGGGITNDSGTVTLNTSTVGPANTASFGGGISNFATLTMNSGSHVTGNTATSGGGIYNTRDVTMNGGAITKNTASLGGGIFTHGGSLTLHAGSQVTDNTANVHGGGIYINSHGLLHIGPGAVIRNNHPDNIFIA